MRLTPLLGYSKPAGGTGQLGVGPMIAGITVLDPHFRSLTPPATNLCVR